PPAADRRSAEAHRAARWERRPAARPIRRGPRGRGLHHSPPALRAHGPARLPPRVARATPPPGRVPGHLPAARPEGRPASQARVGRRLVARHRLPACRPPAPPVGATKGTRAGAGRSRAATPRARLRGRLARATGRPRRGAGPAARSLPGAAPALLLPGKDTR